MISIKELRDCTNLSQSKFAKEYEIPLSTLRKWEQAEAVPAPYLIKLLARVIPSGSKNLEKIVYKENTVFYYDRFTGTFIDSCGNKIFVNEDLDGVKRENLPLYVNDLFKSYYEMRDKFIRDCEYDKKEDFIWG